MLRAARTIFKDEEITDNYGHYFQVDSREDRQAMLQRQYFFECLCKACKENWPTLATLRGSRSTYVCTHCGSAFGNNPKQSKKCSKCKKAHTVGQLMRKTENMEDQARKAVCSMDASNADVVFKKYSSLLEDLSRGVKLPSWDVVLCQQIVNQTFSVRGNFYKLD